MQATPFSTHVLIIGAGPVGMISALSLAQAGVPCILIDKRLDRLDAPKAHAVNPRTLEICERLGVSADGITAAGASAAEGGHVHFMDTLTGPCFGTLPYERQDAGARAFTPWPLVNIAQPQFEDHLRMQLARCNDVSLLRGMTATDLHETDSGVVATLNGAGWGHPLEVTARYCIAADGAGSTVRSKLGIGLTGPEALADYMMIHFEADLRTMTQAHPGLLYFCLSPTARGAFIGYDRARTWVFMQAYDPAKQSREDFDDATCQTLIEGAAGQAVPDLTIRNVSPWTMSAQVADRYRQGRIFLVGDAAHRFPPTGGLGLNTGVADAQNLTWKLIQVLQEVAPPSLLDTYETERRPVAQINTHQSLTNSAKMLHLYQAVYGAEAQDTPAHYAAACAEPDAPAIRAAVEIQRPHFDSFNLQLGYCYTAENSAQCNGVDTTSAQADDIDISCYVPVFKPGAYLPLVQLTDTPWLLGLLPNDQFSLVTGPAGTDWPDTVVGVWREGKDFKPVQPFYQSAALSANGALLVRPDGHICAVWASMPNDPKAALEQALNQARTGAVLTQQER
ncbi:MAG: FAD-dependent monooxygenase [Pseudomonadota bacterium]